MLFPILVYILPFVLTPFFARGLSSLKKFAAVTFLLGSFLGELAFMVSSNRYGLHSIVSIDFWLDLLLLYPMAAIPLGFWIVTLAVVGYQIARFIIERYSPSAPVLYCLGFTLGAGAGALFMKIYIELTVVLIEGHYPRDGILPYFTSGLVCGAGIGLVCVTFALRNNHVLAREQAPREHL
jgi:hypothetical protein